MDGRSFTPGRCSSRSAARTDQRHRPGENYKGKRAMPRGSKPGERRGGRQRGTPKENSTQKCSTRRCCRETGNFAARVLVGRRPGSWIAEWMDRRVVRELSLLLVTLPPPNFAPPSSPFNSILERVVRCWHSNAYSSLFSSLFFRLPPNKFLQIPQDLS